MIRFARSRYELVTWAATVAVVLSACSSPSAAPPAATSAPAAAAAPTASPAAAAKPAAGAASPVAAASASASPSVAASPSPAGAGAAATTAPAAAVAPPTGTPITVGVLDDVTGVGAIEGALMRISTDLVVQRTNASGGINGHPLKVVYVDPKGDA